MEGRFWRFFVFQITGSNVIRYIQNQEKKHKAKTFNEEYLDFLNAFEIDYDERYVFKDLM